MSMGPAYFIFAPFLFASLVAIVTQKPFVDMALGAYGSMEMVIRVFGVLV